jgi:hypothetical protein
MQAVRIAGVVISQDFVDEVSPDGDRLLRIPKSDVLRLGVAHGFMAERILLLLVLGIAGIVGGLFWLYAVGGASLEGIAHFPKTAASGGFVALFGVFFIRIALKRGTYLTVTTHKETRKLAICGVDVAVARRTLQAQAPSFGYSVSE